MILLAGTFRRNSLLFVLALQLVFTTLAFAAQNVAPAPHAVAPIVPSASSLATTADDEGVAPDSPRASLENFIILCSKGRYDQASQYLSVSQRNAPRVAVLARRLHIVMERWLPLDIDAVSPRSEGSQAKGAPFGQDEIGRMKTPSGKIEVLKMIRQGFPGPHAHWVFSQAVTNKVDAWYEELDEHWFLEHLPGYMLRRGFLNLMLWQWVLLPATILCSWFLGYFLSRVSRKILGALARRTKASWDDELVAHIAGPLTLVWVLVIFSAVVPWLGLPATFARVSQSLIRGLFLFSLFWFLSRLVDTWGGRLIESQWARERSASRALVALGVRIGKVAVLVLACVAFISAMGYSAASLLAGLGIGGLAVALAAQKTLEHVFGAFALGIDQPFREGDFVKIEDFVGTVESIGLRSTRIRTLDRTVVAVPNGKLAEMRLESYTARDRLRLTCAVGLSYDTSASQMRQVLEGFEAILRNHPKIWPDAVIVRFTAFDDSSLKVEVMAWFLTTDWNEFQTIRQDVLLQFMECVQRAGTSIAFPTQTIHLATPTAKT
jgi:MscS family membrane protein